MQKSHIPDGTKVWMWEQETLYVVEVTSSTKYLADSPAAFYMYNVRTDHATFDGVHRSNLFLLLEEKELLIEKLRRMLRSINEYCGVVSAISDEEILELPFESVEW